MDSEKDKNQDETPNYPAKKLSDGFIGRNKEEVIWIVTSEGVEQIVEDIAIGNWALMEDLNSWLKQLCINNKSRSQVNTEYFTIISSKSIQKSNENEFFVNIQVRPEKYSVSFPLWIRLKSSEGVFYKMKLKNLNPFNGFYELAVPIGFYTADITEEKFKPL